MADHWCGLHRWLFARTREEKDADEHQPLVDEQRSSCANIAHRQRPTSRLAWAEASWTRWLYLISWRWINPLLSLGYTRTLTDDDLDDLPHAMKCSTLYEKIKDPKWSQETTFSIFARVFWKRCVLVASLRLPLMFVNIAQPLLLHQLVLFIQDYQSSKATSSVSPNSGYVYAIALFASTLLQVLIFNQYYFLSARLDLSIRSLLLSTIYTRLLSINTAVLRQTTTNHVINIVTNDVAKFEVFFKHVAYLCEGPLKAGIIFTILCWLIGPWATLFGYSLFVLLIPLQIILGRQFHEYRQSIVTYTDQRIHAFAELINGCQVIKLFNWEKYMKKRVSRIRQLELDGIRRISLLRALNMGLFFASVPLMGCCTYAGASFIRRPLKAVEIFTALVFYGQMRVTIMYSVPLAIEKLTEIRPAWQRINTFIQMTMAHELAVLRQPSNDVGERKGAIKMRGASFSWDGDHNCLLSLDMDVEPGTFVGVAGVYGSGKSSLFAAILGEMIQTEGQIDKNKSSFSYAAQTAWIFADTLRANILLGKPFDEQRYWMILRACCLDVDFAVLGPSGDLTMISEKGASLSGGQRARVSLARALYAEADVYLLDDPLAAVDRFVAKQIYDRCIGPNGLLKDKTRLLITHQTVFLAEAHQTVFLAGGCIQASGRVDDQVDDIDIERDEEAPAPSTMLGMAQLSVQHPSIIADESPPSHPTVNYSLWYTLFTAPPMGAFGLFLVFTLLVISEILYDGANLWLSHLPQTPTNDQYHRSIGIAIYSFLAMSTLIVAVSGSSYYFYQILNGSHCLHGRMLSGLLHTSMRFFESNPSGRILNRVSKDQQVIDEVLPATLLDALQLLIMTVASLIIIVAINPWMILPLIPLAPAVWMVCRYYLRASQQLKRLESVTRSPIYGHFATSLDGLLTIRAFNVENTLIDSFMSIVDANTRPYLHMLGASRWFNCRLDLMVTLLSLIPALIAVVSRDDANPTLLTLSLVYSIGMIVRFQYGAFQLTEALNLMNSAERVDEYARLPLEEDNGGSKRLIKTPPDWPDRGTIEFRNYSLRYRRNLEPALKTINVRIESGEKVGIIGRTGLWKVRS